MDGNFDAALGGTDRATAAAAAAECAAAAATAAAIEASAATAAAVGGPLHRAAQTAKRQSSRLRRQSQEAAHGLRTPPRRGRPFHHRRFSPPTLSVSACVLRRLRPRRLRRLQGVRLHYPRRRRRRRRRSAGCRNSARRRAVMCGRRKPRLRHHLRQRICCRPAAVETSRSARGLRFPVCRRPRCKASGRGPRPPCR